MNVVSWDTGTVSPSKVVCVGRNFVGHIKELNNQVPGEPVIFIKPNSAISNDLYICESDTIHYEGEITFLISDNKLSAVGFGIDLTKREIQAELKSQGLPWERSKSFDNSAVFSHFVSFMGNIPDLRMELFINNKLVQEGCCELMLYPPQQLFSEIKSFLSFEEGDLLMCGTPKGVGPVNAGDSFTGKIFEKELLILECTWSAKYK